MGGSLPSQATDSAVLLLSPSSMASVAVAPPDREAGLRPAASLRRVDAYSSRLRA